MRSESNGFKETKQDKQLYTKIVKKTVWNHKLYQMYR